MPSPRAPRSLREPLRPVRPQIIQVIATHMSGGVCDAAVERLLHEARGLGIPEGQLAQLIAGRRPQTPSHGGGPGAGMDPAFGALRPRSTMAGSLPHVGTHPAMGGSGGAQPPYAGGFDAPGAFPGHLMPGLDLRGVAPEVLAALRTQARAGTRMRASERGRDSAAAR